MFLKWSRTIHKNVIVIRKFIFLKVWLMCCPYIILFILIWWTTNIESSCLIANSNEQNRSVSINAPCCSSVNSFIVHPILSILQFPISFVLLSILVDPYNNVWTLFCNSCNSRSYPKFWIYTFTTLYILIVINTIIVMYLHCHQHNHCYVLVYYYVLHPSTSPSRKHMSIRVYLKTFYMCWILIP
jgi:uncharacterized membrane protein YvlD (DUF360 family)